MIQILSKKDDDFSLDRAQMHVYFKTLGKYDASKVFRGLHSSDIEKEVERKCELLNVKHCFKRNVREYQSTEKVSEQDVKVLRVLRRNIQVDWKVQLTFLGLTVIHFFMAIVEAITSAVAFQVTGIPAWVSVVLFFGLTFFFYQIPQIIVRLFEQGGMRKALSILIVAVLTAIFTLLGFLRAHYASALDESQIELPIWGFVLMNLFLIGVATLCVRRRRILQVEDLFELIKEHRNYLAKRKQVDIKKRKFEHARRAMKRLEDRRTARKRAVGILKQEFLHDYWDAFNAEMRALEQAEQ